MVSGENENTVFKSIPINADTAKASFDSVFLCVFHCDFSPLCLFLL